jgi:hypothetical protein
VLSKPLAPLWRQGFGAPRNSAKLSRLTGIERANVLPDQRWRSVQ